MVSACVVNIFSSSLFYDTKMNIFRVLEQIKTLDNIWSCITSEVKPPQLCNYRLNAPLFCFFLFFFFIIFHFSLRIYWKCQKNVTVLKKERWILPSSGSRPKGTGVCSGLSSVLHPGSVEILFSSVCVALLTNQQMEVIIIICSLSLVLDIWACSVVYRWLWFSSD